MMVQGLSKESIHDNRTIYLSEDYIHEEQDSVFKEVLTLDLADYVCLGICKVRLTLRAASHCFLQWLGLLGPGHSSWSFWRVHSGYAASQIPAT